MFIAAILIAFLVALALLETCCCSRCVYIRLWSDFSRSEMVEVESGLRWVCSIVKIALEREMCLLNTSARALPSFTEGVVQCFLVVVKVR